MKKQITEGSKEHEKWYNDAKDQTLESLPNFLKELSEDYSHDYGTICHAIASSAIACAWAMNKTDQGGITGFQAGAIMWEFIRNWNYSSNKCGLKIVDYDNILYPQYEDKFKNTISESKWELIKKEAENQLEKSKNANINVINHWKSIVNDNLPFGFTLEK